MEEKLTSPRPSLPKKRRGHSYYQSLGIKPQRPIHPKIHKKGYKKFKLVLIAAAITILLVFVWSLFSSSTSVFNFGLPGQQKSKLKTTDDRVNVLLLGNAGGKHDGPYLTDSIIIASYSLKSKKITLISVPRDLWLDSANSKVNAVYEIGQSKDGKGLAYAEDKIDDILGIPIHYGVRLDFNGFGKAIDTVGGIEVQVPNEFDDYNYPIAGKENDLCGLVEKELDPNSEEAKQLGITPEQASGSAKIKIYLDSSGKVAKGAEIFTCRFEHIHFDKGKVHMDGETALKFVRSRKGTNGEGTDFARSRRQQLVIQAFREKALSLQTLLNPSKVAGVISTLGNSIETDIKADIYFEFLKIAKNINGTDSIVLGDLGNGKSVFIAPPSYKYGAYVLIPPDNDFGSVKKFLKEKLDADARVEK